MVRTIVPMESVSGEDPIARNAAPHIDRNPDRDSVPARDHRAPAKAARLSARDMAILDFEGRRPGLGQAADQEIREHFAMSATRYLQVLNHLLDDPDALAHDPVLVGRLRRLRDARRRAREAPRTGR